MKGVYSWRVWRNSDTTPRSSQHRSLAHQRRSAPFMCRGHKADAPNRQSCMYIPHRPIQLRRPIRQFRQSGALTMAALVDTRGGGAHPRTTGRRCRCRRPSTACASTPRSRTARHTRLRGHTRTRAPATTDPARCPRHTPPPWPGAGRVAAGARARGVPRGRARRRRGAAAPAAPTRTPAAAERPASLQAPPPWAARRPRRRGGCGAQAA